MEIFYIEKIVVLLIDLVGLWLIFWVYKANRKERTNQSFAIMTFFVILWVNFSFLAFKESDAYLGTIYYRINWSSVSLFLVSAFYFYVVYFLNLRKKYDLLKIIVLLGGILLSIFSLFTDLIIKGVIVRDWGNEIVFGYGNMMFNLYSFFIALIVVGALVKKHFSSSYSNKVKLHYIMTGTIIFIILNVVFNIILPLITNTVAFQHMGDYSAIILVCFTAYAITKNELMGIKTLLTQVLIVVMTIILIVDVVLLSNDLFLQFLKLAVLITFLYFSREMVRSVNKEKEAKMELEKAYGQINHYVDQLEEMNTDLAERNDDLKALLEASGKASEALDPRKIAQDIVDSIPKNLKHLGYLGGMIALYDKDTNVVMPYTITQTKLVEKALKFLEKPFERNISKIRSANNLISKTILEKTIHSGDSLAEFIAPTVKKSICDIIQKMLRAHSVITIPLISRGRVNGIILFVGKRSIKEVAQRDKDMLYMFSSHVGAAIENAKLYAQTNDQVKEMEKLNKKLEGANENLKELLEIKNEFLHITSHQLRTPLTAIRGMLSMWYEGDFDNLSEVERRDILKRIYMSTERLNNITNDMLDALEIEGGLLKFQFVYMPVTDIIKETIDTLKSNYDEKGLYINFSAEENMPEVKVEPNYIRQVFMNVIDNASKYTKKGGVDISVINSGKYVKTTVKDTGVGASKDDQKRLFEKFTRGKNAIKENASGSGLGLFIAKKIVEKHHGTMSFSSEGIGMGSTVTISLPAKKLDDPASKNV